MFLYAREKTGVIVVDVQGDFTTWKHGSLAASGTDKIFVEKVNNATKMLANKGFLIIGTQDWHPNNHVSFYSNYSGKVPFQTIEIDGRTQVLWPPHCIQGTKNAKVLVDNNLFTVIVKKGKNSKYDSYSGFQDDGGYKTEMGEILKHNGTQEVIIYGIAIDYCVKATAIDAADIGYKVIVVKELSKGVAPDTTISALKEMKRKGIRIIDKLDEIDWEKILP